MVQKETLGRVIDLGVSPVLLSMAMKTLGISVAPGFPLSGQEEITDGTFWMQWEQHFFPVSASHRTHWIRAAA